MNEMARARGMARTSALQMAHRPSSRWMKQFAQVSTTDSRRTRRTPYTFRSAYRSKQIESVPTIWSSAETYRLEKEVCISCSRKLCVPMACCSRGWSTIEHTADGCKAAYDSANNTLKTAVELTAVADSYLLNASDSMGLQGFTQSRGILAGSSQRRQMCRHKYSYRQRANLGRKIQAGGRA